MDAPTLYMCKISCSKKIALGYKISANKFKVLAGSAVRYPGVEEFETDKKRNLPLRNALIEAKIIAVNKSGKGAVFTQDYTFTSPTTAASIVRGHNSDVSWEPLNPTDDK